MVACEATLASLFHVVHQHVDTMKLHASIIVPDSVYLRFERLLWPLPYQVSLTRQSGGNRRDLGCHDS